MKKIHNGVKTVLGKIMVYFILVIFPVLLHDKLNDLTATRYYSFLYVTLGISVAYLLNEFVFLIYDIKNRKLKNLFKWLCSNIDIVFAVLLILFSLLSSYISKFNYVTFTGEASRHVGLYFLLVCSMEYIIISKCYKYNKIDLIAAMGIGALVNFLAFLNGIGIDPFGFFIGVDEESANSFISTFGNITIYGMYAVFTAIISVYMFIIEKKIIIKILCAMYAFMGIIGVIISYSDAAAIALVMFLYCMILVVIFNRDYIIDYLISILMFFVSIKLVYILRAIKEIKARDLESILSPIINSNIVWVLIVAVFISILYLHIAKKKRNSINKKLALKIYIGISGVIVLIFTALLVYCNTSSVEIGSDSILAQFVIDDDWGSGRGYMWKALIDGYINMPLGYQLIGCGPGTVPKILSFYYSKHWNLWNHLIVDNAHNIPLHFLVTLGLIGLIIYLAIVIIPIGRCIKYVIKSSNLAEKSYEELYFIGFMIASFCMFIQGFLCLLDVIVFPFFILTIACTNSLYRKIYRK